MLECVVNVSEGRDAAVLAALAAAAGPDLLDVHTDPHHHRSVLTLVGEDAPRAVATAALARIDLRQHAGEHPRLGAVDVVPFVPLSGSRMADAERARDAFAAWWAGTHHVPCFLYGTQRTLPEVRRLAFRGLEPDQGPAHSHPTAGASAVGARRPLVAYNVWLDADLATARWIAKTSRGPGIRALGLEIGDGVQVSMNLFDPESVGPADAFDLVVRLAAEAGATVEGAELVGLVTASVLHAVPPARWSALDLGEDRTVEARLERRASGG